MDPDPAIFVLDLRDANKKQFFSKFFCLLRYFLKVHLHHFSKIKSHKEVTKQYRNKGFSYYFCLILEGSGSGPLTNRSGSGRPKNIRILWIRIPTPNTDTYISCRTKKEISANRYVLSAKRKYTKL